MNEGLESFDKVQIFEEVKQEDSKEPRSQEIELTDRGMKKRKKLARRRYRMAIQKNRIVHKHPENLEDRLFAKLKKRKYREDNSSYFQMRSIDKSNSLSLKMQEGGQREIELQSHLKNDKSYFQGNEEDQMEDLDINEN